MRNIICALCLLVVFISCKKEEIKVQERKQFDRLKGDEKYHSLFINIKYPNKNYEEMEIYVSENNDTILNQYKYSKNDILDTIVSEYYDLKITKADKPHFYNGSITLHSKYENLKLNKQNRRRIEFTYYDQNKDSVFLRQKISKTGNTINFTYENYYGKELQGILYQIVERDTTNDLINLNQIHLLVSNTPINYNSFLKSYSLDKDKNKKLTLKNVNLKLENRKTSPNSR